MITAKCTFLLILLVFCLCEAKIDLKPTRNGLSVSVLNDDNKPTLQGTIGIGIDFTNSYCNSRFTQCTFNGSKLIISEVDSGYRIVWDSVYISHEFTDKFQLDLDNTYWFGGPERYIQKPLEQLVLDGNDPYVIKKSDNFAVAERYWLNSRGTYIFIDDKVPLFIDQNNGENGAIFLIAKCVDPYVNRHRTILSYNIITKKDSRRAHLHAINNYLGKPSGYPNENMIKKPIWTTWPKYKQPVDQNKVNEFVNSIVEHKFLGGQIEIDENWEVCFGSHVFNTEKFPDPKGLIDSIKSKGFKTAIWINPFVNNDCQNYSNEGLDKGYFVKGLDGNTKAIWWESDDAHQVDFTNPDAAKWFSDKIQALADDPGLDGFKFDAGETDYAIPPHQFIYVEDQEEVPNIFTKKYVETCAQFGDLIEVRSAWRTQNLPVFIRMIDKDSLWAMDDGLESLVTTLIQMNMNGYTLVLPDMVGGNHYRQGPTAELIVRWTQANALMPAIQFGFLPWDYPSDKFDTTEIVRKYANLHEEYSDKIIEAMKASIATGTPVNPPIWWVDPTDEYSYSISNEFLLGEDILVAPVLLEGAVSRDIYLPKGKWKDGISGATFVGPINITDFEAPIDVLPYFIKTD